MYIWIFLFKSIFYYIIFYFSLNWILYLSFFFTFIILGAVAGFIIINYFSHLDTYFFIACSVMPGSFYIIKGISFIIGGYYSDIIPIKFELKFKINFYLILQILFIIFFVLYHLFYYIKYKDIEYLLDSSSSPPQKSLIFNNIISKPTKDTDYVNKDLQESNSKINESGNIEGNDSNIIYDQED